MTFGERADIALRVNQRKSEDDMINDIAMQLTSVLNAECTKSGVHCASKKRALEIISELAAKQLNLSPQVIFDAILTRERMGSTGIGAGIMVNGDVYRGSSGNTGEVGHICVDIDGPACWCGGRGCVEALAGPASVVAAAREAGLKLPGTGVAGDFAFLARAATRGEGVPRTLVLRSARYLGVAAQTLANILDLDQVVLTGPSFALAGSLYVPAIREQLAGTFFARASHPVDVVISAHALESAAVGGAALVLQSELAPRRSTQRFPALVGQPLPGTSRPLRSPQPGAR